MPTNSFIEKNRVASARAIYVHSAMVSHRGVPVAFGMTEEGRIFYSVLNLSNGDAAAGTDPDNDRNYWSGLAEATPNPSVLRFPRELGRVGYGVVPNREIPAYETAEKLVVSHRPKGGLPQDADRNDLTPQMIHERTDPHYSSTARLGAVAPFQVVSDGKHVYVFRQSIAAKHDSDTSEPMVHNVLLVDRFVLAGSVLKRSREVRYQRSGHKTEPASRKDTLAAADIDGKPFYEPTRMLGFTDNLQGGNFAVLLIAGAGSEEKRWQIFTYNTETKRVCSFSVRFDPSVVFDTSDAVSVIDAFCERYGLDCEKLVGDIQGHYSPDSEKPGDQVQELKLPDDADVAEQLLSTTVYEKKGIPKDDLTEIVYTLRTGVIKDDFQLTSTSKWPLISRDDKQETFKDEHLFPLTPVEAPLLVSDGLSACYYHQQEVGPDGKPMKNKACVMLAMGLTDEDGIEKYIGLLNFAVSGSGRLSRLSTDCVHLPHINMQILDETRCSDPAALARVGGRHGQKMHLVDIDPDGLATSGGVLRFGFRSARYATTSTDAVVATQPLLFNDALGRVNLYFKGRNDQFLVLYFNPQTDATRTDGRPTKDSKSQGVQIAITTGPQLSLQSRLDRDLSLTMTVTVSENTSELKVSNKNDDNAIVEASNENDDKHIVEHWQHLPVCVDEVAMVLNGQRALPLGRLEPLDGPGKSRVAYKREDGTGTLRIRTTARNSLVFQGDVLAEPDCSGEREIALGNLSSYLLHNPELRIGRNTFSIDPNAKVKVTAAPFHKVYLSGIVEDTRERDQIWTGLKSNRLVTVESEEVDHGYLQESELGKLGTKALNLWGPKEGNGLDEDPRRANLQLELLTWLRDIAKVRLVTFAVTPNNTRQTDSLDAGLQVESVYNAAKNFKCTPANLGGISARKWEHGRSYLFKAKVAAGDTTDAATEPTTNQYELTFNKTLGQWEDWDASLAVEFKQPAEGGPPGLLYTTEEKKLEALRPTDKGLTVEAWVKPSSKLKGEATVVHYNNRKGSGGHYSLGIKTTTSDPSRFQLIATVGEKQLITNDNFLLTTGGQETWRHIALAYRKHWGYRLSKTNKVVCPHVALDDEYTIEILARIDGNGTLIHHGTGLEIAVSGKHLTLRHPHGPLDCGEFIQQGGFNKITVIRSRHESTAQPSDKVGGLFKDVSDEAGTDTTLKAVADCVEKMASRQKEMLKAFQSKANNLFGGSSASTAGPSNTYYYTVVVSNSAHNRPQQKSGKGGDVPEQQDDSGKVSRAIPGALQLGGNGFAGTLAALRIWGRALAIEEAKQVAQSDKSTGLRLHWPIAEGQGRVLYDVVGENHGVVQSVQDGSGNVGENDGVVQSVQGGWVDSPEPDQPGKFVLYVDGEPHRHREDDGSGQSGEDGFSLGGILTSPTPVKKPFFGVLEEVRVWNRPRTAEQISDNAFGRLKGEREHLLANYTFDSPMSAPKVEACGRAGLTASSGYSQSSTSPAPDSKRATDASPTSAHLVLHNEENVVEVLSTAPVATEVPQIRSALTGVVTGYHDAIKSRPAVVEYSDDQRNEDGTLHGVLKRCYAFVDARGFWIRMTGYKVGELVSEWFCQRQFAPQVVGYLEGPPPLPGENFRIGKDADVDIYAYMLDNSVTFRQVNEVSHNYSTSKEAGWSEAVDNSIEKGTGVETLIAPMGFGISVEVDRTTELSSNYSSAGSQSQGYESGVSVTTSRTLSATQAGYDNPTTKDPRYYTLGNTGYALVKSKTADLYLRRLAHTQSLVSISWQPNPDIPEDVNIIPFPINPLYVKQGTLDGKFGNCPDPHYPQAHGAYGQYSYFKPREAYALKKRIERERAELEHYYEDGFDENKAGLPFNLVKTACGLVHEQLGNLPGGPLFTALANHTAGTFATDSVYTLTKLKNERARMGRQRNLVNTYVWTVEGGFYAESTEVTETQQETYAGANALELGSGINTELEVEVAGAFNFDQQSLLSSGSDFTLTKSRTRESSDNFGLDVNVDIPTSPRYRYRGHSNPTLEKGLLTAGTVDAYRFMTFYLEPSDDNYRDLFKTVIDPIWLDESAEPNAQALREAAGEQDRPRPCWRVMHRVTYVSRVLPEFEPEAPPSLERTMQRSGIESNYLLMKRFEPYVRHLYDPNKFNETVGHVIDRTMPEFTQYKKQIQRWLALYFNVGQA